MIVNTNKGDFTFRFVDDVIQFVRTKAQEKDELWISGEQPYPCISVCTNGAYAVVNFYQNDTGDMWLSYNEKNQEEVSFVAGGEDWEPDVDAIITLDNMFLCIKEFLENYERPTCIQWQEL